MDLSIVKKLLKLIQESEVNEIELEEKGTKIRITKNSNAQIHQPQFVAPQQIQIQPQNISGTSSAGSNQNTKVETAETKNNYHEVRSPIVGTFYRAPSPDAAPYVEIGSSITVGKVLGIVEAMKLMNEIESDISGKIVKVLVENGKPVEYNQVLFLVEKS